MSAENIYSLFPRDPPPPPAELGPYGAELWRSVALEWHVEASGPRTMLLQACQAADRAETLRQEIAIGGELIETPRGGIKANPLIALELQARALAARLLARLGVLDSKDKRGPGRPPKTLGG
jgi:hypothetical protein